MDIEEAKERLKLNLTMTLYNEENAVYKQTIVNVEDIQKVLSELEKKDKEIEYWKEQAEGYSGLAKQIQEEYENRIDEFVNRDRFE